MKKTITLLGLLISVVILNAQTFNFEWANTLSGNSNYEEGKGIGLDMYQNIYVASHFADTVDADPSTTTFDLISNGGKDIIIQKFDFDGNMIWSKSIGGISDDEVFAMETDLFGNTYTIGNFQDTVDFDPSTNNYDVIADGTYDIFILKLDKDGNFKWVTTIGGPSLKYGYDIALDKTTGYLYTTGYFSYSPVFHTNSGDVSISSNGSYDVFVYKLDTAGNNIWIKSFGSSGGEVGNGISSDYSGNILITGYFTDTANFDPNGTYNLGSNGYRDAFVCKLSSQGNFVWAKSSGGINYDEGTTIDCDDSDNIYISGYYRDTVDFNTDTGIEYFYSSSNNIYLQKLDSSGNFVWCVAMETGTGKPKKIKSTNNGIYMTGLSSSTVDFDPDTTVETTGTTGIFVAKYTNNGNLDKVMGIGALTSNVGYDIDVNTTNEYVLTTGRFKSTLDFDPSPTGTYEITSAQSLYDAFVLKLYECNLTYSVLDITTCNSSYTSPSGNYTWISSGTYNDTIQSTAGCDSIITINLTINNVDVSVTQNGLILTANATGAIYQWGKCDSIFIPINGQTNQSFTVIVNGSFGVIVSQNGCTDTSDCFDYTNVGILNDYSDNSIKIYPNPSNNQITVECKNYKVENMEILDITGKTLKQISFTANKNTRQYIDLNDLQKGIYFIKIQIDNKTEVLKFIKE